jgi:hypothetical protein
VDPHSRGQAVNADQMLLAGAYFIEEYSFESTALFNPNVVAHPDQTGLANGAMRIVLSFRGVVSWCRGRWRTDYRPHIASSLCCCGLVHSIRISFARRAIKGHELIRPRPLKRPAIITTDTELSLRERRTAGQMFADLGITISRSPNRRIR